MSTQAAAQDEQTEAKQDRDRTLVAMRSAADQIVISLPGRPVRRMDRPLFRYDDPARKFADGSIWAWGDQGRPVALVVIARNSTTRWMVETVSFADDPIKSSSLVLAGRFQLRDVSRADEPHRSANLRKSQMKIISRKFEAFQMWDNDGQTDLQRYELRLLAQPIHEYANEQRGILSGAIFLFNYGSNPELAMILEAHQDGWKCGFGRMGWAAASVRYNGQLVFEQPKLQLGRGDDRYAMFSIVNESADEAVAQ